MKSTRQVADIGAIVAALIQNGNDAFHALADIESQRAYNYIEIKYLNNFAPARS